MNEIRTLRAGILVSLKTSQRGNVRYYKQDIERPHRTVSGAELSRWDTTKTVFDPEEAKEATQVVGQASYLIRKLCVKSEHGLICPVERRDELNEAIRQARLMAREFNSTAVYTNIGVNVVCGEIVADDVNTARALFTEVEKFMVDMQTGLEELNVEKVRAIIRKTKDVGRMLSPEAGKAIASAVEAAGEACKKIVKAGEQAAIEIDEAAIDALESARNTFLDFDLELDEVELGDLSSGRALDFDVMEAS